MLSSTLEFTNNGQETYLVDDLEDLEHATVWQLYLREEWPASQPFCFPLLESIQSQVSALARYSQKPTFHCEFRRQEWCFWELGIAWLEFLRAESLVE